MNKYQEALECIGHIDLNRLYDGHDSPKYAKDFFYGEYILLQELVDKTIPKKPIVGEEEDDYKTIYDEYGFINPMICVCPNCGENEIYDFEYGAKFKHCTNCGQAIDWSSENE